MDKYVVDHVRGKMVGYDYFVVDRSTGRPVLWSNGKWYSDDENEAEAEARALNTTAPDADDDDGEDGGGE